MSRATPGTRALAERLITFESEENRSAGTKRPEVFFVGEKLRPQLATLMGSSGFRALVARSLVLATVEMPWLKVIEVRPDGSLDGFAEPGANVSHETTSEARVVLLAQLLGLLVAFVGERLTLNLVREVWPKLSVDPVNFSAGDENEK